MVMGFMSVSLAKQFIVVGMTADPEPLHSRFHRDTQSAITQTDADAAILAVFNQFELQRWVRRILFEQIVIAARNFLNVAR